MSSPPRARVGKKFPKKASVPPPASWTGVVVVAPRGAERLQAGHVWVYRSDVVSAREVAPGAVVPVHDHRGKLLGTALYSSSSQIAVRMIAHEPVADFPALLRARLQDAVSYRERVVSDTDAYRLVFSEADFLPGLIVDRYHDVLSLQILTQAMDAEPVRAAITLQLQELLKPAAIAERVDARVRELEQLPARSSGLVVGDRGNTVFTMNGVRFHFDALEGQKTGAFLDQRENYAAAAEYTRGETLDAFCYQGGFALHLAKKATRVTGVDSSRPALEVADKNALLNQRDIEWIEANAFDVLKDYSQAGRQYDTIVLDPPAFAKSRKNLETAMRGYKELNLRALKMLRPGGTLVTCSCSYHVGEGEFVEIVAEAARDAHRTVRLVEKRGAAKDHPVVLGVPETSYLKCLILTVTN
jgi:23S rRNA (cytosine1962-C5)-methyltransferase